MKRSGSDREAAGPQAGFTLIEALAALAIAAAGFAVITQMASSAFHNWSRGRDGAAALDMLTTGLAQVGKDLRQALPIEKRQPNGTGILFAGEPDHVLFAATTGLRAGDNGVEMVSIRVVASTGGRMLVREHGPLVDGIEARLSDPVPLMQGRLTYRFAFIDDTGRRSATWGDRPTLPTMVELDVLHQDGRQVLGPPQSFVLPANFGIHCLDPDHGKASEKDRCPGGSTPAAAKGQETMKGQGSALDRETAQDREPKP